APPCYTNCCIPHCPHASSNPATAPTDIYTLSLHDALPISRRFAHTVDQRTRANHRQRCCALPQRNTPAHRQYCHGAQNGLPHHSSPPPSPASLPHSRRPWQLARAHRTGAVEETLVETPVETPVAQFPGSALSSIDPPD